MDAIVSKNVQAIDNELALGLRVLDQYTVLGKLAQGGMAEVYLAQSEMAGDQKLCVLKRVRPHLANDRDFVAMFTNEARLAAQINHPNVVQIYDLGQSGTKGKDWFLAMEYLDGRDMLQIGRACRAHNKAVPFYVTARIIADACAGLDFAHQLTSAEDGQHLNLVHRDMSPENIVITFDGQVKVVDFGIAKAKDNAFRTQAGQIKGKLGYVAPEAILGKSLDARADIFAIGATLYLFLCGRPAFTGQKPMEIFEKSLKPPTPPSEVNARVPIALEEICMRCLRQNPDERYQSAEELKEALEIYLHSTGRPLGPAQLAQFMQVVFPADTDDDRQRIDNLIKKGRLLFSDEPASVSGIMPEIGESTAITPHELRPDVTHAPAEVDFDNWSNEAEHTMEVDQRILDEAIAHGQNANDFSVDSPTLQLADAKHTAPPPPFSSTSLPATLLPSQELMPIENATSDEASLTLRDKLLGGGTVDESIDIEVNDEQHTQIEIALPGNEIADGPSIEVDASLSTDALDTQLPNLDLASIEIDMEPSGIAQQPPLPDATMPMATEEAPMLPPLASLDEPLTGGLSQNIAVINTVAKAPASPPSQGASFIMRALSFGVGGALALALLTVVFHFAGLIPIAMRFLGL